MIPDIGAKLDKYKPSLLSFANSLTKNHDDADDLFQETAVKIIRNQDKYKEGTNFRAWSYTIMRNIFINNYRKKKRRNLIIDQTDNNYYINSGQTIENRGEGSMRFQEVMSMVNQLSEEFRVPFLLRYRGYKYDEIATELKLPLGTVKSRIHFARRRLRDMLNNSVMYS